MSLLPSGAIETTGYDINNSLRFRASAFAFLSRTPASASNRQIWTWSGWVKRGRLGVEVNGLFAGRNSGAATYTLFYFSDTNTLNFLDNGGASLTTTQLFRDPSAWYHLILSVDTTQATAANRVRMYVNGNQITAFTSATYPTQNANLNVNATVNHVIGDNPGAAQILDGYMAEVNFIDGQALTPSSFGETDPVTGVWKAKKYTGTYGTNGFYLKFSDIATTSGSNAGLGKDFSGNANYWTTNNISVTAGTTYDAMIDSPTLTSETVANYAVLNPVYKSASQPTFSNANLTIAGNTTQYQNAFSSIGVTSGKWYCEVVVTGTPNSANMIGVANTTQLNYLTRTADILGTGSAGVGYGYFIFNGQKYTNSAGTSYGNTIASGDIVGIALDLDNGKIWFSKNGTWQASGDPAAGTNAAFTGIASDTWSIGSTSYSTGATSFNFNFGQRPFSYTPPTGFVRLNTFNLPDSTIKKGSSYMDATLYTGNGSTQTITNASAFKPDLVWNKGRSSAVDNCLTDSVRGTSSQLVSNTTGAQLSLTNQVTAFNSNGFSLGADNLGYSNFSGITYVGWQWQAGQSSGVSNTDGSITTTISASATAGFSVIKFTGTQANATIGHGLGVAPKMVIVKTYGGGTRGWRVYHASVGNTKYLILNDTSAETTDSTAWNNTTPTSTVISLGANGETNNGGSLMIAYAWAEIAGFSKFGSYTGNGSADGPFIATNFAPKFVLVKRTDSSTNGFWNVYDSARNGYNDDNDVLYPNSSSAEDSVQHIDLLSNGFKCRNATYPNTSGATYIYACFASNPFKSSNAR